MQHILIIDDQVNVALTLQDSLEVLPGCEIAIAAGSEEALRLFEAGPFDLVITDYKMPGTNGVELAAHIRQQYPHTAIIMITAYGSEALRKQAASLSIAYVLDKPVELAEIRRVVSQVLYESDESGGKMAHGFPSVTLATHGSAAAGSSLARPASAASRDDEKKTQVVGRIA